MVILSGIVQVAVCAFFLGQVKQAQAGFEQRIEAVTTALEGLLKFERSSIGSNSDLVARMGACEKAIEALEKARDDFLEHRAQTNAAVGAIKDQADETRRGLSNQQRQISALMTGSGGAVLEMRTRGKGAAAEPAE